MQRERLFTTGQAAGYCGMTVANFRSYIRKGKVTADVPGRPHVFRQSTLDAFKALPRNPVGYPPCRPREKPCNPPGVPYGPRKVKVTA